MPQVLTTSAHVVCSHGGGAQLSSGSKLKVSGTPVLLESGVGTLALPPCPNQTSSTTKDTTVSISGGQSQKLFSDGSPVLLSTLSGKGDGAPQGAVSATESQTKLAAS